MAAIKIFLGSSAAARTQAKVVVKTLTSPQVTFVPWWEHFTAGKTLLEQLNAVRSEVDGALLLFSPEIPGTVRQVSKDLPNQNVLFEFGFFSGIFGTERVAVLRYGEFYLPSDLGGLVYIQGSKGFRPCGSQVIGKATTEQFNKWIATFPSRAAPRQVGAVVGGRMSDVLARSPYADLF